MKISIEEQAMNHDVGNFHRIRYLILALLVACSSLACLYEEGEEPYLTEIAEEKPGDGEDDELVEKGTCTADCADGTVASVSCSGNCTVVDQVCANNNQVIPGYTLCWSNSNFSSCPSSACIPAEQCTDGEDNDFDGLIDCADPDCLGSGSCECITGEERYISTGACCCDYSNPGNPVERSWERKEVCTGGQWGFGSTECTGVACSSGGGDCSL